MKTGTLESKASFEERSGLLERPGHWWRNGRNFLTEVRNEMRRVTWPSRREVYATTVVVILVSIFFGLYLWGVDLLLNALVGRVFQWLGAA